VMSENGAFEGLMLAVKQGKVRFPGFSSHTMSIAVKMLMTGNFYSVQVPYNFIDRQAEEEVIPLAKKMNTGIIAMKPLGGGLLDKANLCFKFIMQDEALVPDPGIEKHGEMKEIVHIAENLSPLTAQELEEIERIRLETGETWCHRCDYCQPCPQDIKISNILVVSSFMKRMSFERAFSMVNDQVLQADKCTECRTCAGRCPYGLDIPKLLKENTMRWKEYVSKMTV
ncbi:MAG: aldo/keto reductase, partial [Brevinematales bacterium]